MNTSENLAEGLKFSRMMTQNQGNSGIMLHYVLFSPHPMKTLTKFANFASSSRDFH